ncbi:UNVERIFIED_CONTAM: hypothetical protein RMT77_016411 [Armadillidium vulgare]
MPGDERGSPSSMSEFDSALGTSTASPGSVRKANSGCSSMSDREEENFECYGEAEDGECDSDSAPARIGDEVDGPSLLRSPPNSLPPSNFGRRNSWVRRSLRGSPCSTVDRLVPPKRWGSFRHAPKRVGGTAVASQLYRTSSFSSGRSSAPDQDDMYSDASLEDDVLDLNQKNTYPQVQMLQQQVGVLAENQVNTDDRYTRVKQDNSALQARVMMLEEQLRETEMRAEDRLSDEQKRNKELIGRVEREKQLTVENYSIKYCNVEKEKNSIVDDNQRLKKEIEKLEKEKLILQDKITEAEINMSSLKEENVKMGEMSRREKEELRIERERGSQVIEELRCEVERLRAVEESYRKRSPSLDSISGNTAEMEAELKQLKDENKLLLEQVEDLQAQLLTSRLEEGRTLVSAAHNSLAAEFEQMTNDEEAQNSGELEKLRKSLKDCQEANHHLRAYIDGILLNIVENYPQLLEVKRK